MLPKIRWGNASKNHLRHPVLLSHENQTRMTQEKKNHRPVFFMNIVQNPQKKYKQTELKGSYTVIKWDLFQRCKDGSISASQLMWYTTLTKIYIKNYMIILTDAKKLFDKIQYPFMRKTLDKMCIEGIYLSITKAIMRNPQWTSYSIVKKWKLLF